MSSIADNPSIALPRPRGAAATRAALLAAARSLFDEVGYDRATTREIGERAGVDPALIARYFERKEGLFLAAIAATAGEEVDPDPRALLAFLLQRWDGWGERGQGPLGRALASPALSETVRQRVSGVVRDSLLRGLVEELRARRVPAAELRAELLVALALGVAATRANGTLERLAAAPREDVLAALAPLVDALGSP